MTYGRVPGKFLDLGGTDFNISHVPVSTDWKAVAQDVHWLMGLGTQLIPSQYCSGTEMGWKSGSMTSEFYLRPKMQGIDRIWIFRIKNPVEGTSVVGEYTLKLSNSDLVRSFASSVESTVILREKDFAPTNQPIIVSLTATCMNSGSIISYSCFELPRVLIESGSDGGIDDSVINVRERIHGSGSREGMRAIAGAISSSIGIARTPGVLNWNCKLKESGAFYDSPFSASSTTNRHFSTFSASLRVRRMNFHLNQRLTGAVEYAVCLRGDNALASGAISFQTACGTVSLTGNVGNGYRWISGTLPIRQDGTSMSDFPDSDFFGMKLHRLGTGTVYVHAISLGERDSGIPE